MQQHKRDTDITDRFSSAFFQHPVNLTLPVVPLGSCIHSTQYLAPSTLKHTQHTHCGLGKPSFTNSVTLAQDLSQLLYVQLLYASCCTCCIQQKPPCQGCSSGTAWSAPGVMRWMQCCILKLCFQPIMPSHASQGLQPHPWPCTPS